MRDEIQAGLKNALERGDTIEQAVQSFISAGYNPVEVKEAANSLSSNISPIVSNINSSKAQVDLQNKNNMFTNIAQSSMRNSSPPQSIQQNQTPQTSQFPVAMPQQQIPSNYAQLSSQQEKTTGFHSKKFAVILGIILLILAGALAGLIFFSKTLLSLISGNG